MQAKSLFDDTPAPAAFNSFDAGSEIYSQAAYYAAADDTAAAGRHVQYVVRDGDDTSETLTGTSDADIIHGNGGNDQVFGGASTDMLFGDGGRDTLAGGGGNDQLFGGNGNDTLIIKGGFDQAFGDAGKNTYVIKGNGEIYNLDNDDIVIVGKDHLTRDDLGGYITGEDIYGTFVEINGHTIELMNEYDL